MLKKSLGGLALLLACIGLRAPASVWDGVLRHATQGSLGLLDSSGSVWEGSATLGALDPEAGVMRAVMPLSWRWHAGQLLRGRLAWDFSLAGSAPFRLQGDASGISIGTLRISLPARLAMERIPNTLARAGWQGDWLINVPSWRCDWRQRCSGDVSARWESAGSDLFPGRILGNYRLDLTARDGDMDLRLGTEGGDVQINGAGRIDAQRNYSFNGKISGDAAFVNRIPNVASPYVRRTETAGVLDLVLQGRF